MADDRRRRTDQRRWEPESVLFWKRIVIDIGVAVIAFFLFVYTALNVREPTIIALFLGAGLTLLGYPAIRRAPTGDGNGKTETPEGDDIRERWSGLP